MAHKIICLTSKGGRKPGTLERSELVDLVHVEKVFELLLTPLLPHDAPCKILIEDKHGIRRMGLACLYQRTPWFTKADRACLATMGASVSGIDEADLTDHLVTLVIYPRKISAHDAIENRYHLNKLCKQRGLFWPELSIEYDAIVERTLRSRDLT